MQDVKSRDDIKAIIDAFYELVKVDALLGPIFNKVAGVNWEHHLPIMYDFWDFTILNNGSYARNVMTPHYILHEKIKLTPLHFERWLHIFYQTIDASYAGENAQAMKQRAHVIAETLKYKLGEKDKLSLL
jgi:hemoglobin